MFDEHKEFHLLSQPLFVYFSSLAHDLEMWYTVY